MRSLIAVMAAGPAVLAASSCATPAYLKGVEWVAGLPEGMWVIEVGPESKSIPCSPAVCQAGMNMPPYLLVVQYSRSQSGPSVHLDGRVEGCSKAFRRSLALEGLAPAIRRERYERLFREMTSSLRKGCGAPAPKRVAPIELDRLILEDES